MTGRHRTVEVGEAFGRLTVLTRRLPGELRLSCRCDCGAECLPRARDVFSGRSTSCGCFRLEQLADAVVTHGHTRRGADGRQSPTRTYTSWVGMRDRCTNPANPDWQHYGGRGITVCERWAGSFEMFLADMGECPPGLSIDRVDNARGYDPTNCRWATATEQARNRRPARRKVAQ